MEAPASPPPPGTPRKTVVLRAGAPAPKGRRLDLLVGIVGLILLIATIGLAWYLPDRTYLNPQFRLSFPETIIPDQHSSLHGFTEGEGAYDFTIDFVDGNVKAVTLQVGFADDLPYSTPDRFEVELLGPDGVSYYKDAFENPPPREAPNATAEPTVETIDELITIQVAPTPTEQIVGGLSHRETPEQVLARLEPEYRVDNAGTWTVRVTLLFAGDCPTPGQEGTYPSQAFHCRFGTSSNLAPNPTGDGTDTTQEFVLANVGYTFYTPTIQELS